MTERIMLEERCMGAALDRYPCILLVRFDPETWRKRALFLWGGKEAVLEAGDVLIHTDDVDGPLWDYEKGHTD